MNQDIDRRETISYEKLYRQWEQTNWSATDIDFTRDTDDWREKLNDKQREALLWNYSLFLVGEESVARNLTPVLDAAEGFPESIFLTTQIVDEARHHVFFDRFVREVAGLGTDTASTLRRRRPVSHVGVQAGLRGARSSHERRRRSASRSRRSTPSDSAASRRSFYGSASIPRRSPFSSVRSARFPTRRGRGDCGS